MEISYNGGDAGILELIISPYSSKLSNGQVNAKSYPYWNKLVYLLSKEGYEIIQIGVAGEDRIEGVSQFVQGWPFAKLRTLVADCAGWISVDNFFPHFVHCERLKPGIVLWGPSDPRIWGYPENINLLRGRDFLRPHQMQTWNEWDYNPQAFVYAENVVPHVHKLAPIPLTRRLALV